MEQVRLTGDDIDVVILPEVGARLHRLRVRGHDLLRTPADPYDHLRDPFLWGAYVMAPWANRVEAGPIRAGSRRVAPGANFPDGSAIHGQVYARPWQQVGDGRFVIRAGGDGWPWEYEVGLRIQIANRSLRIELTLTNLAVDPMPAGIGLHPWFRRPLFVAIKGEVVYRVNTASQPQPEPVSGSFDLRDLGEIAAGLDATWAGLADPPIELRWPTIGTGASIRITARHLMSSPPAPASSTPSPSNRRRMPRRACAGCSMASPAG